MTDSSQAEIPDFATLAADPEIAPLLNFEPVVRKIKRPDGWTPELQRELIARIAATGTIQQAVWQMGKHATGAEALYKTPTADAFRKSWDAAVIIGRRRNGLDSQPPFMGNVPGINRRTNSRSRPEQTGPLPGQVRNEHGEWEDEASFIRRGEEARDNICAKLLNCRRLYLAEISGSPGKRAAFEILTELPIDWEKAAQMQPQADEPWHRTNQRQPDMILTAENGWSWGECGYGPDRKAELRAELDKYRAEEGLEPVDWSEDDAQSVRGTGEHRPDASISSSPAMIGDPPSSHRSSRATSRDHPTPKDRSGPRVRRV
jgi:hypothetical protein